MFQIKCSWYLQTDIYQFPLTYSDISFILIFGLSYNSNIQSLHPIKEEILIICFHSQTSWSLGQDCGFPLCNSWCINHCITSTCDSIKFQLLLPSWDGSGGNAVSELQPCDQLPVFTWNVGTTYEEKLFKRIFQWFSWVRRRLDGDSWSADPKTEL